MNAKRNTRRNRVNTNRERLKAQRRGYLQRPEVKERVKVLQRERSRRFRQRHPGNWRRYETEKAKATRKVWAQKNRQHLRGYQKTYRQQSEQKNKNRQKRLRYKALGLTKEWSRKYRTTDKYHEYQKEYLKRPEVRESHQESNKNYAHKPNVKNWHKLYLKAWRTIPQVRERELTLQAQRRFAETYLGQQDFHDKLKKALKKYGINLYQ